MSAPVTKICQRETRLSAHPENYPIVGRVLAELIGPDCVALYHPESKRVVPANLERTTELLRSEDPIAATFR